MNNMALARLRPFIILMFLLAGLLTCGQSGDFGRPITTNVLYLREAPGKPKRAVPLRAVSFAENDNGKSFSICKALAFRVSQIVAREWQDNVFRSDEIQSVETGWNTPDIKKVFIEILKISNSRVTIDKNAHSKEDLSLSDCWFRIKLKNGREITISGTEELFTDRFLLLRAWFEKGKREVPLDELLRERKRVENSLIATPFKRGLQVVYKDEGDD